MANPMTLPLLGILSLAGAGAGLYLGKAAVGEINPAYFRTPEPRLSYSDLSGYRSPSWAASQTSLPPIEQAALGTGCVGCTNYPEEYYPEHEPAVDGFAASATTPAPYEPAQLALQRTEPQPAVNDPGVRQVERYARMIGTVQAPESVEAPDAEASQLAAEY